MRGRLQELAEWNKITAKNFFYSFLPGSDDYVQSRWLDAGLPSPGNQTACELVLERLAVHSEATRERVGSVVQGIVISYYGGYMSSANAPMPHRA
jgi:hypothetical protein